MQVKPEDSTWFHCFQIAELYLCAMRPSIGISSSEGKSTTTAASQIKAAAAWIVGRHFNGTWRQGQLPSGQTAKVRQDYRVQSLHKGHARHAFNRNQAR